MLQQPTFLEQWAWIDHVVLESRIVRSPKRKGHELGKVQHGDVFYIHLCLSAIQVDVAHRAG